MKSLLHHIPFRLLTTIALAALAALLPAPAKAGAGVGIAEIKSDAGADMTALLSGTEDGMTAKTFEVKFSEALTLGDNDAIVVKVKRTSSESDPHPLALELYDTDGGMKKIAVAYLFFRGVNTTDYSDRIYLNDYLNNRSISKITVKALRTTASPYAKTGEDTDMKLAGFDLIKVRRYEPYGDGRTDRLHFTGDYENNYRYDKFEFSNGIFDEHNRKYSNLSSDWGNWSKWDENGKWTADKDLLDGIGVTMPQSSMLSQEYASGKTGKQALGLDVQLSKLLPAGERRQAAHTTEHTVYAMPGDVVPLYPYYEMEASARSGYMITYSHWYDWVNGGHIVKHDSHGDSIRLLDVAIDPSVVKYSEDHGYFGGAALMSERFTGTHTHTVIETPQDWIDFANKVNNNKVGRNVTAEIMCDIDFAGYDNVPCIGIDWDTSFRGKIEGNGHRIFNLHIRNEHDRGTGIIGRASEGCTIQNLILDESCLFEAHDKTAALIGVIDGHISDKKITISNVDSRAHVRSIQHLDKNGNLVYGWYMGGFIGRNQGEDNQKYTEVVIRNCHVGGVIETKGYNHLSAIGDLGYYNYSKVSITNVYVDAILSSDKGYQRLPYQWEVEKNSTTDWGVLASNIVKTNCYDNNVTLAEGSGDYGFTSYHGDMTSDDFLNNRLNKNGDRGWIKVNGEIIPALADPIIKQTEKTTSNLSRGLQKEYYATVGTFFYPRDPMAAEGGDNLSLTFPEGKSEYTVAADFSQSFNPNFNIESGEYHRIITEPIIHFRHIFHIKDGKTFAEQFSADKDANETYVKNNKVVVSACVGMPFQVRLGIPVPKNKKTKSNVYYKAGDDDYRRVCSMKIRVLDDYGNENHDVKFDFAYEFNGNGSRNVDGVSYKLCDENEPFYRMLVCETPMEGKYRVQLIGLDSDGNEIEVFRGGASLVVAEYDVTFENENNALFKTEAVLYGEASEIAGENPVKNKYKDVWPETLDELSNAYVQRIDFDEYRGLEKASDPSDYLYFAPDDNSKKDKWLYKWPLEFNSADYAFAYDMATNLKDNSLVNDYNLSEDDDKIPDKRSRHFDYNEYMIVSHSSLTQWHGQVDDYKSDFQDNGDTGMYDRLYYSSRRKQKKDPVVKKDRGYFYYVNAATDPGMICSLPVERICFGSTIHVSAWIAEFSGGLETANVAFKFNAVLSKDAERRNPDEWKAGDRITIHTFISGYVDRVSFLHDYVSEAQEKELIKSSSDKDKRGKWMNVYYTFLPKMTDFGLQEGDVEYYELVLINNSKSSHGADYAVDDIRLYVQNPSLRAVQLSIPCNADEGTTIDAEHDEVKVRVSFDELLQKLAISRGTEDDNEDVTLYYTFIDKGIYDEIYDPNTPSSKKDAFAAAVKKIEYNSPDPESTAADNSTQYGFVKFNTWFESNDEYVRKKTNCGMMEIVDIDEFISFNVLPKKGGVEYSKPYYIAMSVLELGDDISAYEPGVSVLDVSDKCSPQGIFSIEESTVVKIDGWVSNDSRTTYCSNMRPVVQLNLRGESEATGEVEVIKRNAYFDWYYGSMEEFNAERPEKTDTSVDADDEDSLSLAYVLQVFRSIEKYQNVETLDGVTADISAGLTDEMIDWLRKLTTPQEDVSYPMLTLHAKNFIFPPIDASKGHAFVTAVPIDEEYEGYRICADPRTVQLDVNYDSPGMKHGFREDQINYPSRIDDVPLRVSMAQIKDVSIKRGSLTADTQSKLVVPVRKVDLTGLTDAKGLTIKTKTINEENTLYDDDIILVWTDDKEYSDLGSPDFNGDEGGLLVVGEISRINAYLQDSDSEVQKENIFECVFFDDFKFKEGYTYKLRFPFEENGKPTEEAKADGVDINDKCPGQETFTMKVVPQYLKWIGTDNHNFNNDDNWTRVASGDLLRTSADSKSDALTDGSNPRTKGFAPLDFTSVIIPDDSDGITAPQLYGGGNYKIAGVPGATGDMLWANNPGASDATLRPYADVAVAEDNKATKDVAYDMVGYYPAASDGDDADAKATSGNVYCRPWYANTCKDIHFHSGSEILRQQHLCYDRAWVDMEMKPLYWQLASSPLKETFAGEFFAPSDNARQETPLFEEITYDKTANDRFSPAVFQRSWNSGRAIVYELPGTTETEYRNVAVKAGWSNVYNDVQEQYGAGTGFSIRTDASGAGLGKDDDVLFRLPKADDSYDYFEKDKPEKPVDLNHGITRRNHYKLNDAKGIIESRTQAETRYFLVGNPFMAHLDMKEFLQKNSGKIKPQYWMVRDGVETTATIVSDQLTGSAPAFAAPMQGFFVELLPAWKASLKADKTDPSMVVLELDYTEEMAALRPASPSETPGASPATRGAYARDVTVSAVCGGKVVSSALLMTADAPDTDLNVTMLDNTDGLGVGAQVYAVADGKAASISMRKSLPGTELGVVAKSAKEKVTLLFDGIEESDSLVLFNANDGSYTDIDENLEYTVVGSTAGLFIMEKTDRGISDGELSFSLIDRTLTVVSPSADADVRLLVADISGVLVCDAVGCGAVTVPLDPGVYTVRATDGKRVLTAKIIVR